MFLREFELRGADTGRDDDDRTGGAAVARPTVSALLTEPLVSGNVLYFAGSAE
jgi:hypothetical protein